MNKLTIILYFILCFVTTKNGNAQVAYNSAATYGLRKIHTAYAGSAIQVIRSCDNATANIGFTSCGDLDTASLKFFVLVPNPLSAISTAAAAAYGLRRLSCTYAGPAIRITSSAATNPTLDINFTALGDLDTAAMKVFIGANSASVSIWYDQSGNNRHARQATIANQPRIMNAGAIEYQNGRPTMRFSGLSTGLETVNFTAYNAAFSFNGVARVNSNLTYNGFVSKTGTAPNNNFPGPFDFYNDQVIRGNGTTATFNTASQVFNAAKPLSIWTFQGTSAAITTSLNSSSILSAGAAGTFADAGRPLNIGRRNDFVTGVDGWISEVITFGSIPSATDIRYVEWTQSQYYNISGPTIVSFPAGVKSASVITWYDQSGNAKNATPPAAANRPLILSAGFISRKNSWPVMTFNGSAYYLTAATTNNAFNTTNGGSINAIGSNNGAASWQCLAQQGANSSPWWGIWGNSSAPAKWTGGNNSGPGNLSSTVNSSSYCAVSYIQSGAAASSVIVNGVSPGVTGSPSIDHSNSQLFYIGYSSIVPEYWNGAISEINVFAFNLNHTRRLLLQSNQNAYHNMSFAAGNIKYTPPSATTYNRFVLGIGREGAADNFTDTQQSAGMGFTVGATASDYLKDNGDYMTAGINCPITNTTSVLNLPATVLVRWDNDWYVVKTDVSSNNGTVSFYFDFSDYSIPTLPGVAANYRLLNRPNTASNFTIVPGTTPSVSGDRVYFSVDASNIVTNSYFTIGSTNPVSSPLPIQLLNFEAKVCEQDVCLNWSTANEINNERFVIQRSSDANDWMDIKSIKGSRNSQRTLNYESLDTEPLKGLSYYRLKQVDMNGDFSYSIIRSVEFKNLEGISIYPNPTSSILNINHCGAYEKVFVTNSLGQTCLTAEIKGDQVKLDLSHLTNGDYFVTLINTTSKKRTSTKVILSKAK